MKEEKEIDIRKLLSNPVYIVLIVIGLIIIIFVVYILVGRNRSLNDAPIKEGQIMIQKGDEVITINSNGLVEYKSKDKVYYETWDTSRISSFFTLIENKARESLKNPDQKKCVYKIYLFLDGKLVNFCTDDEEIADTVEEISNKYSEEDLSGYFQDGEGSGGDGDEDFDGTIHFPTPTPTISLISPVPTPTSTQSSGGSQTNYPPVNAGCDTWSVSIVGGRAVISNTYCTTQPTATPTP
ncbi:MAG TPA: hypothetical protein VI819_04920 [Patescibacteria group bacterium]|nr:hypothetical protein [Patescibacteria group bacterium]